MFNKPDTNGRKRVGEAITKIERAASERRTYRVLELVAIVGTVAALLTTYFMIGRGAAEMNPVASWLLEDPTSGSSDWFVVVAVGLIAVSLSFAILRRYSHVSPRYVLAIAAGAALVHVSNGLNDLYILATAGFPESFLWSNAAPVVGFTLLLAGVLASRHLLTRGLELVRSRIDRRAGRAFVLALLLAASVVAMPFMGGVGPIEPDHGGTAAADHDWDYQGESHAIDDAYGVYRDDSGNWWVVTNADDQVYKYNSDWSSTGTNYDVSTEDGGPQALYQKDNGNWLMVGVVNDNIYEYDENWNHLNTYNIGTNTDAASGIEKGPDGNWWLVDDFNTNAVEYDSNWNHVQTIDLSGSLGGSPSGVRLDADGNWWVTTNGDNTQDRAHKFNSDWSYTGTNYDLNSETGAPEDLWQTDSGDWWVVASDNDASYRYGGHATEPVTGQVTDKEGNALEGVAVGADHAEVASTTTNSTGYYQLDVPDAGTYEVTADDGDYVSTKTVDVPSGGISGVDFALGPANPDGQPVGLIEDDLGVFPPEDTQLVVYERSTEYKSVEDGMSVETWHEETWTEFDTASFNWRNKTTVDLVNGRYYRFELEGPRDSWEDSGILYNDTEMSGSTIWLEPDTSSTDTNGDGTSGGDGSSGTNAGTGSTTPTPDEDGTYPTVTEQQGFGPTALGTCSTLDGQDGVEVEYWDPNYETYELRGNLTVDGSTTYHIRKSFDSARGYYRGCIADSMTDNASTQRSDLGFNHTALDEAGNEISTGAESWSAPTFGPTGNAPASTGERLGLLAGVLGALGVLWVGGNRVVPASSVRSWPSETINPAFGIGAPIVTVLGLDLAGGGVISAGVATGLAQIAPFAGIVGVSVVGYAALRWIRAPPSS